MKEVKLRKLLRIKEKVFLEMKPKFEQKKYLTYLTPLLLQIVTMKKIIFSPINSLFTAAALLACSAPALADLPSFPLNDEFTTSSIETVSSTGGNWTQYVINSTGVWNIVGDMAQVNWNYEGWHRNFLTGDGTINLGSDTQGGALYIMGSNPVEGEVYNLWFDFSGTINVARKGQFTLGGSYNSHYGQIFSIGTLNINGGTASVLSETANNSYFSIKNLTVRDGGMLDSALCLTTADGGEWNLHSGGGVVSSLLRVQSGTFTLNLLGENALSGLPKLSFDNNLATDFRINVSANNSIETLELNSNAILGISVADGATLNIENLTSKSNVQSLTDVTFVFYDYSADSVLFGASDIWVEDNRLYIPSINTFVDLIAYDGEGGLLQGEWIYEWNGETGKLVLNAVPEPAAVSAVLGALALALVARRKRK